MKYFLSLYFVALVALVSCSPSSIEETLDTITNIDGSNGNVRLYQVSSMPTFYPDTITATGVSVNSNADKTKYETDVASFVITVKDLMTMAFAHVSGSADTSGNADFAAFAILYRVFGLYEYEEGNGVPGFQNQTADAVTGYYHLDSDVTWKAINCASRQLKDSKNQDFTAWTCEAQTTDEVFTLRFTVTGRYVQVGTAKIDPNSMKVDFIIKWFDNPLFKTASWTSGPSTSTTARVGLISGMASGALTFAQSNNPSDNKPEFTVSVGEYTGFFKWEPQVEVKTATQSTVAQVYHEVTETAGTYPNAFNSAWIARLLVFSFDAQRPTEIVWDPEYGAQIGSSSASTVAVSVLSTLLVLLAVVF